MVILSLRIKTADEWRELAPGEAVAEPVFVPTTDELESGQSVIIEVSSQLLPNKVLIRGAVQSVAPRAATHARARRCDRRARTPTSKSS